MLNVFFFFPLGKNNLKVNADIIGLKKLNYYSKYFILWVLFLLLNLLKVKPTSTTGKANFRPAEVQSVTNYKWGLKIWRF